MEVKEVAKTLIEQGGSYLRHRSLVANIKITGAKIRESFNENIVRWDFSENIAMKPKFEVEDAHFSGNQYFLHCSIIEPGTQKYFCHLRDNSTHDPDLVDEVCLTNFLSKMKPQWFKVTKRRLSTEQVRF